MNNAKHSIGKSLKKSNESLKTKPKPLVHCQKIGQVSNENFWGMVMCNEKIMALCTSVFTMLFVWFALVTDTFADRVLLILDLPKRPYCYGLKDYKGVVVHSTGAPEINIQKYESRTWRLAIVHYEGA